MKVQLPEKISISKKQIAIYIGIIVVCIISVIVAIYLQFYARIDVVGTLTGKEKETKLGSKTEEEIDSIKSEFDNIFTNNIENGQGFENKKEETEKELVYTKTEKTEIQEGSYDINVHIPYININNEAVKQCNKEIENFVIKANDIVETKNKNIIYTVEYTSNVQNDILSLIIRSNLKEGGSAQRVIVQCFNYDLRNNKEISLEEILKIENIDENEVQSKIKNEIEFEQKKVDDLMNLGYKVYSRNLSSDIYDIKNSKEFYINNNTLYIIYAYGNTSFTSEMDMIII